MPSRRFSRFAGADRDLSGEVIFASVQSLHRHLHDVEPDVFDYVVVDEFHHADAPTYRKVIAHLRPKFLLGLTATPDRSDAADLLSLCSDNLVFDCGLVVGVARGLLSPFAYRAIKDVADYAEIPWRSGRFAPSELTERLETQQRAQQIFDEWLALNGPDRQTLGFCCSITHAEFMAEFFRARGVTAVALHSGPTSAPRADALERFRSGGVRVLFTVDLFNEGVDVPAIEVVLLLRPTESRVVFFQQLGRGLRRSTGKEQLDVLDLVGNHRSFLLKSRLLAGLARTTNVTDREAVRMLEEGVELPPGCSIIVDPEVIDLLKELAGPARKEDRLKDAIEAWKAAHDGQRPTALELTLATGQPHDAKQAGGWFGVLRRLDALNATESAAYDAAANFLIEIEHGSYSKSFKLITLQVLVNSGQLRPGMSVREIAIGAHWLIDRDHRLRLDLADTASSFSVPGRPTTAEWGAYWRKNPINALTGGNRASGKTWFTLREDHLMLELELADELWPALEEMVAEIVEYQLHRYLVRRGTRRAGEHRRVRHSAGRELDAAFVVEHEADAPIAVYIESAGGAGSGGRARNTEYVAGFDLALQRMRRLGLVIEDCYIETGRTGDLPIPDRRLSPGDAYAYPIELDHAVDLGALRTALLRSMAATGRAPGATGSGNRRKAVRLVISGTDGLSARSLADALADGEDPARDAIAGRSRER